MVQMENLNEAEILNNLFRRGLYEFTIICIYNKSNECE